MKRPGLLSAFLAFLALAAPAHAAPKSSNPLGIEIVRFAPGTSSAAMGDAVAKAGGSVVTDLSPIGAVAVAPSSPGFSSRVHANAAVTAAFPEPLMRAPLGGDDAGGPSSNWSPAFGSSTSADPWHDASSFLGVTNPEGILQWDDGRMDVAPAWTRTHGDRSIRVAILDTGIEATHRELKDNIFAKGRTFVPCAALKKQFGAKALKDAGLTDCGTADEEGHGTWVASRIAGELNGFASNGVAPNVEVASYKVLAANFGGFPDWILAGLVAACNDGVDFVNMSIVGYWDPTDPAQAQMYLLYTAAVQYCRARGVTVFASAGNEHVRVDRVRLNVGGVTLDGIGRVSTGLDGIALTKPGDTPQDLRGLLESPAGVPGVVDVSATNNGNGPAPADDPFAAHPGARDQLTYYSNYGSRIDLAAPGGARRYNLPAWDGGAGDTLYGGWGSLGALAANGTICTDPLESSLQNFACFKSRGDGFGWLQGTSMSAPNALGVAALAASADSRLRHDPAALITRLQTTARRTLTNYTGPTDPAGTASSYDGRSCATGFCHLDPTRQISFADAYGAGLVDAGAATAG